MREIKFRGKRIGMNHYDASLYLKFTQIVVIGNAYDNPELLVKEG
ncbi:MAG: hypothetical protein ACYDEJ_03385 [Desulfitobacteriaceae bacterium]